MRVRNRLPWALLVGLVVLSGCPAWSADAAGGNRSGAAPDGKASAARASVLGWNYRKCAKVTVSPYGAAGSVVKVVNTDGSWVAAATLNLTPNIYQMMLLRACRQPNTTWGWNVTNASNGSWSSAEAY